MFAGMTDTERARLIEATPSEIRQQFGVLDPREHLTPEMADRWTGHEFHTEAVLFMARRGRGLEVDGRDERGRHLPHRGVQRRAAAAG